MFERYTESGRRALFFARYEASQLGSVSIDTEHLLLGLLRDQPGTVSGLLGAANVPAESLKTALKRRIASARPLSPSIEIPFTEGTKRVLQLAAREADDLHHRHIGPEHLLLGLMRDEQSAAGAVLAAQGLRVNLMRKAIAAQPAEALHAPPDQPASRPAGQIAIARDLVEQAGRAAGDLSAVRELVERIVADLDALKTHLT